MASGELDPFGLWDLIEERLETKILSLIVTSVGNESRNSDVFEYVNDRPSLQRPSDIKLRWTDPTSDGELLGYVRPEIIQPLT